MDDNDKWWLGGPLTAEQVDRMRCERDARSRLLEMRRWQQKMIFAAFPNPLEVPVNVRVSVCVYCNNPVSEMAGFTKLSLNKIAHTTCHVSKLSQEALAAQETVLTESFQRREAELVAEINKARAAKGESTVVTKSDAPTVVFDTATWDAEAEKVCKLAVAQIGPTLPLHTLKRYAWFIYTQLRDKKLIQPLSGDKAEETPNEALERNRLEIEEWLRKSTKK